MARPRNAQFIHYKQWQMDSLALGKLFLPALEQMAARIPRLQCAVLCTHDGFNICSLGLQEDQVGKMAALSSSLISIGQATANIVATNDATPLDIITMDCAGTHTVMASIPCAGNRLVLLASSSAPLGAILVGVRFTCTEILRLRNGR